MDFWKYSKQGTPITKPQLLGSIEKKKKEKISPVLFMAFFTEIRQYRSQNIFPGLKSISNGKKQSCVGAFSYRWLSLTHTKPSDHQTSSHYPP